MTTETFALYILSFGLVALTVALFLGAYVLFEYGARESRQHEKTFGERDLFILGLLSTISVVLVCAGMLVLIGAYDAFDYAQHYDCYQQTTNDYECR